MAAGRFMVCKRIDSVDIVTVYSSFAALRRLHWGCRGVLMVPTLICEYIAGIVYLKGVECWRTDNGLFQEGVGLCVWQ